MLALSLEKDSIRAVLTSERSRLAGVVTFTTVISNVPACEGEQPEGAGAGGLMTAVTPWGTGLAKAAPTNARRARVYRILNDCLSVPYVSLLGGYIQMDRSSKQWRQRLWRTDETSDRSNFKTQCKMQCSTAMLNCSLEERRKGSRR